MKPRLKLILGIVVALALLVTGLYQGWRYFYPLESSDWLARFELARDGVKYEPMQTQAFQGGTIAGLSRDYCGGRTQAEGCACVALVHGLGDSVLTWKRLLMAPADTWDSPVFLLAIDLPGSGKSPPPLEPIHYRVSKQAAAINLALQTFKDKCPRWMVVGNSLGGWIATWMALENSPVTKINKLVLVGSAGLKSSRERMGSSFTDGTVESLKKFQELAYHKPRPLPDFVWKAAAERARTGNSKQVREAQLPEDDLDGKLPELKRPTMVVRGASDRIILKEDAQRMASLIPGAVYRELPECGHLPQKECPGLLIQMLKEMVRFGAM